MATGASSDKFLHKRTICVITGASRGIGKQIAIALAEKVANDSAFIILARNKQALESTAQEIKRKNSSVEVKSLGVDLIHFVDSKADVLSLLQNAQKNREYESALIIHNAGSLGAIDKLVTRIDNAEEIRQYFDLNFVSMVLLNNLFLEVVERVKNKIVVNITSMLALKSFPGFGLYAAGKAARDAFMRSLAAELDSLRVLSYAPGPVDTEMLSEVAHKSYSESTREFIGKGEPGSILTCEQTVNKLLSLLETNEFLSGSHVDYYDD